MSVLLATLVGSAHPTSVLGIGEWNGDVGGELDHLADAPDVFLPNRVGHLAGGVVAGGLDQASGRVGELVDGFDEVRECCRAISASAMIVASSAASSPGWAR